MNNSVNSNSSELDMAYLQQLLRQRAQRRQLYENIAILGCGYVGSALAACWQEQGHFVTGTTTRQERVASLQSLLSKVAVITGDDANAIQSLVQAQDTVVVSVAPTGFQVADEATYEQTYLTTAKNLLQALKQTPSVKQVIYLSSCSVYGDRQGEWVDENAAIFPSEPRSQMLYEAEQIISQANSEDQRICILRLGGIYGPGRELVGMLGGMAGMTLPGRGERVINWIHRDDIVGVIEFARLNQLQGIYNLVDDSQLTIKDQLEQICSRYGLPSVHWDQSRLSLPGKSVRVSNYKLKATGYQFIYPQSVV
ncbi:MAG: SDR family oxidoreductase [Cyanobacteria bacterium P01_D01_bin.156]